MLVIIFTVRDDAYRIISARKGNAREKRRYETIRKSNYNQNEH